MTTHLGAELVPPETFVDADLVVGRPQLRLVAAEMERLNVTYDPGQVELSKALDLVLIKNLRGLPDRAARIRADAGGQLAETEAAAGRRLADLEVLLFELRRRFEAQFGGWVPEMGKNRHLTSVLPAGPGGSKPMGGGSPSVLDGPGGGTVLDAGIPPVLAGVSLPLKPKLSVTVDGNGGSFTVFGPGGGKVMLITTGSWTPSQAFAVKQPIPVNEDTGHVVKSHVLVGVLDTALFPHEFLDGHLADPSPLFERVARPDYGALGPMSGHATFVASLIANEAPDARIDLRSVLEGEPASATMWETAKGIASFIGADIEILNLSLGCRTFDGKPPLVLAKAVQRLGSSVLVVAAAGNHGASAHSESPVWPAALPGVVAVGAVDPDDGMLAAFSPRSPWVAVTAPGVGVEGAYVDAAVKLADGTVKKFDGWARWSGTSFAAATVTGMVAARTVPGAKSARQALEELLSADTPVRPYQHPS